jgi:FkbM family methyltransferase
MADALFHLRKLGFLPRTVIDVGVADGTPDLYRVYPEPDYLLIDPLAEYEGVIKRLLSTRLRGSYICAAAASQSGTLDIVVQGSSSGIFREVDHSDSDAPVRTVPAVTLDHVVAERRLATPYLLKADVQGAELQVLNGAISTLKGTEVLILEVSLLQAVAEGAVLADVIGWMDDQGFATYDIFGGHFRPYDGALAQVDFVFVKTHGQFRRYQGYR